LVCCDLSRAWMEIGEPFWVEAGVSDKIDFRHGEALDTLNSLISEGETNQFDFAFIDADKENYQHYYECCLKLVKPQGLIMIDNTLWEGAVCDAKNQQESTLAIRAFNTAIHQDKRVYLSQLPIADGLTLALLKGNK